MSSLAETTALPLSQLVSLLAETQRLAGIAGWEWRTESRTFFCTELFHALTGWHNATNRVHWADVMRLVHPEDRRAAAAALRHTLSSGAPMDLHLRLIDPAGRLRYVHSRAEMLFRDGGRPASLVGTLRDETEAALHAQEAERVNAALRTLSACNRTLITATDERSLLTSMCAIIVETGGYACAWATLRDDDAPPRLAAIAPATALEDAGLPPIADADLHADDPAWRVYGGEGAVEALAPAPGPGAWQTFTAGAGSLLVLPLKDAYSAQPIGTLGIGRASTLAFEESERRLLQEMADDCSFGLVTIRARGHQREAQARLQRSMTQTVQALAATIEKRDPYTAGHQRRVADITAAITGRLGVIEAEARGIILAATIHDIGKVYVPSDLLTRPGRLTADEFRLVQAHPRVGHDILRDIELPWPVADMVLQHHERLDGSGYPDGLRGDAILLGARIIGVADVLEAMASHRPYRPGLGIGRAVEELRRGAGTAYDAEVVTACVDAIEAGDLVLDAPA